MLTLEMRWILGATCALLSVSDASFLLGSSSKTRRRLAAWSPCAGTAALGTVLANTGTDGYGPFEEGTIQVSRRRGTKGEDTLLCDLHFRIYNPSSTLTPLVVCHGGP
jgi:hypothetical protein